MAIVNYHCAKGRLIGEDTNGIRTDYMTDALGSVTGTVNSSQAVVNTYRYKPFGELLAKTGTGADPKFMWNGSTQSRRTGIAYSEQYNRASHYGTRQGQWTTVDPLWPRERAYGYAQINPSTKIDPTGRRPFTPTCSDDCCADADKWFEDRISHCRGSSWGRCPEPSELNQHWKIQSEPGCFRLEEILIEISRDSCEKMCGQTGGGSYPPDAQWDAAAFCCVEKGGKKAKGCKVQCCQSTSDDWKKEPKNVRACAMLCLLEHENNHLRECDKFPPLRGQPPYSECCAYAAQAECLAKHYRKAGCEAYRSLPPEFKRCQRIAEAKKCSGRYS